MNPKVIVLDKPLNASLKFLFKIEWWDQVIVIPEDNKIVVFNKGILNGLKGWINLGGHIDPNSTLGERLLWKKAQKKAVKNKISEIINKIIPHFIFLKTIIVWLPWKVASRQMSRHHWYIVKKEMIIATKVKVNCDKCIVLIIPIIKLKVANDPVKGHGLLFTKWKGCNVIS